MNFPNKIKIHDKPLILSQEQKSVLQMVSTHLGKKDVIIFGKIVVMGQDLKIGTQAGLGL